VTSHRQAVGVDIGGTGIKASTVDPSAGSLIPTRHSSGSAAKSLLTPLYHFMPDMGRIHLAFI